jgi:large subunit ribosomal protein L19
MNIVQQIEQENIASLGKDIPDFDAGDTLRVHVKVKEGNRERVQVFEGVCIARHNKGIGSSFTVRKISFGEGVERIFPLYSPTLEKIDVVRKGEVRRAKLYYLRGRTGRAARIREKQDFGKIHAAAGVATAAEAAVLEATNTPDPAKEKTPEPQAKKPTE